MQIYLSVNYIKLDDWSLLNNDQIACKWHLGLYYLRGDKQNETFKLIDSLSNMT